MLVRAAERTHTTPRTPKARLASGAAVGCMLLAAVAGMDGPAIADDTQTPAQIAYTIPGPASVSAYPTPFARTVFRSVSVDLFPKWHDAIKRTDLQLHGGMEPTSASAAQAHRAHELFDRIVEQVAARSGLDMLVTVNNLVNAVPYRTDQELYGVSDYWATPIEMLAAGGGDCEDHAIAKLAALKQAGVSTDKLRLVVGIDTATGKAHAMAVVEMEGVAYVLDSRTHRVVSWGGAGMQFKPLYAAGFQKAWIYRS